MTAAFVSNIQKCCVYDGPGLRTVVFLMGCPLRCKWCQNPENLAMKPVVLYDREKCLSCGKCLPHCENQCGTATPDGILFDRSACVGCGVCAEHCYPEARTLCGREMTVDEVYEAVMRDEVFYRTSGGGVTLSGGEPTMHAEFCIALFQKLHEANVPTALETCGFCSSSVMRKIAEHTDLFLYDFKVFSEDVHQKWTAQSNRPILENMRLLHELGKELIIRIPLIPGVNDGDEFRRMMSHLTGMERLKRIHLLPFHQVGSSKYVLSDTPYELEEMAECDMDYAQEHAQIAEDFGFEVNIGGWDAGVVS